MSVCVPGWDAGMTTLVAIMGIGVDVMMTGGIMIGTTTAVRIVPTSIMMLVRVESQR